MSAARKKNPDIVVRRRAIGIEIIGLVIGSVLLGAAAAVSILMSMDDGMETVSVTGLLNLLVTVGLATAAIVLAVVAISLSRMAERSIVQKTQELNALQSATMAQTARAIERMEEAVQTSSEQIAGTLYDSFELFAENVLDGFPTREQLTAEISNAVERTISGQLIPMNEGKLPEPAVEAEEESAASEQPEVFDEQTSDVPVEEPPQPVLEDEPIAADPVMASEPEPTPIPPEPEPEAPVVPPEPVRVEQKSSKELTRDQIDKKYDEFKDIVLLGVANFPGVTAHKIGEGLYRTEGDDLADGAFSIKSERVAVCTFCTNLLITQRFTGDTGDSFFGFLKSLYGELKRGHFDRVFMVFDGLLTSDSPYAKALNEMNKKIDPNVFSKFELFEGSPESVIPELTERVSQLMAAPVKTPEGDESTPDLAFRRTGA